eukprot:SAG11_NODE_12073_length_723_cov_0.991987_1_plen_40_part_10
MRNLPAACISLAMDRAIRDPMNPAAWTDTGHRKKMHTMAM